MRDKSSEVFDLKPTSSYREHMSACVNVRDLLDGHVTLELNCIDRLYLNGYVPRLQYGAGIVEFLSGHRGNVIASPALLGQITDRFVAAVKGFARRHDIPLIGFERKESKDRRAHQLRVQRPVRDTVVFIGVAQEKAYAFSARRLPGKPVRFEFSRNKSVIPNYDYFYLDDEDLGRPDRVQLIFPRKIVRTTPGSFRTTSSNTSKRGAPCVLKAPSTIRVTSG